MTTELAAKPKDDGIPAPQTLPAILLRLGPGMILVGNIVGSGELISTPLLAARAGYTFLGLILFSCFIKVFFQIEIGRYAISEGRTTLDSLNDLPGPRTGVHWILWYWIVMSLASVLQQGAMVGGIAQALNIAWPVFGSASEAVWAIAVGVVTAALLVGGRYSVIERVTLILVALFTLVTLYTVISLQFGPHAMSWSDVQAGFSLRMPEDPALRAGILAAALAAFGITGVGASEIIMYPYWCLEKGYGRFVGRRTHDEAWAQRARGWMRVMHYDAWISMLIFTIATVAFYILGAALLHPRFVETGELPQERHMIARLSIMYSQTFGDYSRHIFFVGAFCVLYSTLFVSSGANARMLTDWLGLFGAFRRDDDRARRKLVASLCVFLPLFASAAYLVTGEPVLLVTISAVIQALMLPLIGIAVLYFAHRRTDPRIRGGRIWYVFLWLSFMLMSAASIYMGVTKGLSLLPEFVTSASHPQGR